jgi:hypothetical protein
MSLDGWIGRLAFTTFQQFHLCLIVKEGREELHFISPDKLCDVEELGALLQNRDGYMDGLGGIQYYCRIGRLVFGGPFAFRAPFFEDPNMFASTSATSGMSTFGSCKLCIS